MQIKFIGFVTFFLLLIAGGSYLVYFTLTANGLVTSELGKRITQLLLALLPLILLVTMALGNFFYNPIVNIFYMVATTYLATLMYLFLGSVLLFGIKLLLKIPLLHFSGVEQLMLVITYIIFGCAFALIGIGVANAGVPQIVEVPLYSKTLSENWYGKRIVLVSDIHLGMVRGGNFMKRVVDRINTTAPDLVLVAGDIIDGPVFPYARDLAPLAEIRARYGVFGVDGNHEKYNRQYADYEKTVNGFIPILNDKRVVVNDTQIIGIDYRVKETHEETRTRLQGTGFRSDMSSIILLHDPKNVPALPSAGVSFSVSGHTHCGQFWPISIIVKKIYGKYTHGMTETDGMPSFTTCGVGTAMSPIRIGNRPEIVVFTVQ